MRPWLCGVWPRPYLLLLVPATGCDESKANHRYLDVRLLVDSVRKVLQA